MKYLLFIVMLGMGLVRGYSQSLIQTYTDRCTGETQVFTAPMNGQTVVVFYNRSKSFTSQDFQNGNLRSWLEETYLLWRSLNPCSIASTGAITTQQTTQQVTQQATQAATNAVATTAKTTIDVPPTTISNGPTPNPPETSVTVVDTASTDTAAATTDVGSQASSNEPHVSTDSSGTTDNTTTETQNNTNESETTSTEATQNSDETSTSEQSNETSAETETSEGETQSEENSSNESDSSNETEETSEEVEKENTSEESTEESPEEETTEEESNEEELSEETSEEKKEEDKKKKKRALAPPIVTANVMSIQDPSGKFSSAAMFGVSQSSLMGDKTYGLNAMVYSNMQQFMLTANYSKVHINDEGRINRVYSASLGGAKMFTTFMGMTNHSLVFLGKKGSVAGVALGLNLTSIELDIRKGLIYYEEQIVGSSLTGFYTKPFNFERLTITPMLAVSSPFASYEIFGTRKININTDLMFISGSSFNYTLSKRFAANLGVNAITSTIKDFPLTWSFTIGSRLQF